MKITLIGQVPAQKNDKRMAYNSRTGKPFPVTSPQIKAWKADVALQLSRYKGQPDGKAILIYQFYVKDNRRRDIDNMICSINDALVTAGLLKDDSWQNLAIGGADAEVDTKNPRAEIYIEE